MTSTMIEVKSPQLTNYLHHKVHQNEPPTACYKHRKLCHDRARVHDTWIAGYDGLFWDPNEAGAMRAPSG